MAGIDEETDGRPQDPTQGNALLIDVSRVPDGCRFLVGWDGVDWSALVEHEDWWIWKKWEECEYHRVLGTTPQDALDAAIEVFLNKPDDA